MRHLTPNSVTALGLAAVALAYAVAPAPGFAQNAAPADTAWQRAHPRREEVNSRLNNQNRRIQTEVRRGEISPARAAQLHQQDGQIRQEERAMASRNGGRISPTEQRALNQQENGVSREIGR